MDPRPDRRAVDRRRCGGSPACFAISFGVPISVALAGYLWAIGAAEVPLRATAIGIPATLVLVAVLFPLLGLVAVGIAYIASSLTESVFFVRAAKRTTTFKLGAGLAIPVLLTTVSGACGWLVAHEMGPTLAAAVLSSVVALVCFVSGLVVLRRAELVDAWTLIRRGLRGVVSPRMDARNAQAAAV